MSDERHIFISHIHEDDEQVRNLKDLLGQRGMEVKNSSVTLDKFNDAKNEEHIKSKYLRPGIDWASVLVVVVSAETKDSKWVNWEIEYAQQTDTRIIAVYEHGEAGVELPDAAKNYADAVVGWDGQKIVDAINGEDIWEQPDGSLRPQQPLRRQRTC